MTRTPRRIGLLDAMILVAAVAIGLAWSRAAQKDENYLYPTPLDGYFMKEVGRHVSSKVRALMRLDYGMRLIAPCVACLSIGLLALRLRATGFQRGVAAFSPGVTACASVIVVFFVRCVRLGIDLLFRHESLGGNANDYGNMEWLWDGFFSLVNPVNMGMAVVGSWVALMLSKGWKPEPSAIDRVGRLLGVYWIAAMMIDWAAEGCFR